MARDETTRTSTTPPASEPGAQPVIAREQFISVPEAADIAGRNNDTIRRWIRHGELRATRVGREYRILEADLLNKLGRLDLDEQPPSAGGAFHLRWGPLTRFELRDD